MKSTGWESRLYFCIFQLSFLFKKFWEKCWTPFFQGDTFSTTWRRSRNCFANWVLMFPPPGNYSPLSFNISDYHFVLIIFFCGSDLLRIFHSFQSSPPDPQDSRDHFPQVIQSPTNWTFNTYIWPHEAKETLKSKNGANFAQFAQFISFQRWLIMLEEAGYY